MRLATCHELPDVDEALVRLQEASNGASNGGALFVKPFFAIPHISAEQAYSINLA